MSLIIFNFSFLFRFGVGLMALLASISSAIASPSLRILDPATSPVTPITSVDHISNDAFRAFAAGALSKVEDSFAQSEQIDILLIRIPVVAPSNDALDIPDLSVDLASAECTVSSPWVDLSFDTVSTFQVSATLIWNERQLLLDASNSGARYPAAPRQPYPRSEFEQYAQQYGRAISSQETDVLLLTGLPADLGELFRNSPQSTLLPFSENARATIRKIALESVAAHVEIVGQLIDKCVSGKAGSYRFSNIHDITN